MKFNLPKLNAPKLPKIKVPKFNILIKVLKWLGSWLKKMTRELVILGSLVVWLLTINFRK